MYPKHKLLTCVLVGFASKEAYARRKIIMTSTLLEPITAELGRRATLTSFPYNVHDAFVQTSHDHRAVLLNERGSLTIFGPLSTLLARAD